MFTYKIFDKYYSKFVGVVIQNVNQCVIVWSLSGKTLQIISCDNAQSNVYISFIFCLCLILSLYIYIYPRAFVLDFLRCVYKSLLLSIVLKTEVYSLIVLKCLFIVCALSIFQEIQRNGICSKIPVQQGHPDTKCMIWYQFKIP